MRLQIEADYFSDPDDNDDVVRLVDELKELRLDIVRKPGSLTLVIRLEVLNRSHAANYIRDRATLVLGPGDTMFKLEVTALGSDQERVLAPRQPLDVPFQSTALTTTEFDNVVNLLKQRTDCELLVGDLDRRNIEVSCAGLSVSPDLAGQASSSEN